MTTLPAKWAASPLARLSADTAYLLAARVVAQALTLVFTLAVARTLGEQGFGQFAFISAVVAIANVVTTFGLDTMLIRDVAASDSPATANHQERALSGVFSAALLIQLGLSALILAALAALGPSLLNQTAGTQSTLLVAALSLIPLAFSTVFSAILRGRRYMGAFALFSVATAASLGLGAGVLWRRGGSLLDVALILLAAQIGGAVVAYLLCRRASIWPGRWSRPTRRQLGRAWRTGGVLAGLMILAVVYQRLDVLLLSMLAGDAATGFYAAAVRILEALKMLPGAFFGALLPLLAAEERPQVRRAYRLSFAALLGLSLVLAAITAALARPLVGWLFGPAFDPAIAPLRLISWSLPLTVVTFKLSFDLVARGQERFAGLSMLLTLLVAVPITYLLIARWSLIGAAIALPACEGLQIVILGGMTALQRRA